MRQIGKQSGQLKSEPSRLIGPEPRSSALLCLEQLVENGYGPGSKQHISLSHPSLRMLYEWRFWKESETRASYSSPMSCGGVLTNSSKQ